MTPPQQEDSLAESPAQAFRRFMELTATPQEMVKTEREEFLRLLEPFLRNPRYRGHVEMIAQAAFVPRPLMKAAYGIVSRVPWGRRDLERSWVPFLRKAAAREQELLKDITYGEFVLDLQPVTHLETPPEWRPAYQVYQLTATIDVDPAKGLTPDSVSMTIDLEPGPAARVLGVFPKSEIEKSAAEVHEGAVAQSSSSQLNTGLSAKAEGIGASLGTKWAEALETSEKVTTSRDLVAQRIVSAKQEHRARWQVFRTAEQTLRGGRSFFVMIRADAACENLGVTATAVVGFEGWGETRSELKRKLALREGSPPAAHAETAVLE